MSEQADNTRSASDDANAGGQGQKQLKQQQSSKKQLEKMARIKKKAIIMNVIALVCIILGITGMVLWQKLFGNILKKELSLSPQSMSFKMWKETPIPMYLKIYLYNWTNPSQVLKDSSVKPHFSQMGPYTFREVNTKVKYVWNDNATITYQQRRVWHFEPTMSNGELTDKVTTINPITTTIVYSVRNRKPFIKTVVDKALKYFESMTVTKTVKEFLFDGYDDELLKLAVKFNATGSPFDKFGWFYSRNGSETYDGIFNMLTGKNNMNEIGMLKAWKYDEISPYYSNTCGPLKGTNGDLWPPLPDNDTVSVFSPDICTTLTLKANGNSEWLGVTGSKYISDADMLDNGTNVEARKCYCKGVDCQPSGLLNVSSCKYGAPAFISLPHFYLADESYRENITGMEPNKKDHEFQLIVEPSTGIPMQVRAALQINFLVHSDKELTYFSKLPKMYAPMLWFQQEVNLTSEYASQIKLLVVLSPLGTWISVAVIALGILLSLISGIIYIRQRRDNMNENLIPKDRENEEAEGHSNSVQE